MSRPSTTPDATGPDNPAQDQILADCQNVLRVPGCRRMAGITMTSKLGAALIVGPVLAGRLSLSPSPLLPFAAITTMTVVSVALVGNSSRRAGSGRRARRPGAAHSPRLSA